LSNTFFQFKQFTVQQDFCAMKVSTDSCIFGAAVATVLADKGLQNKGAIDNYLDIGAGTGLLSLMLAQKTSAFIDAVEIDNAAFSQAAKNFEASRWKERLSIINLDIQDFKKGKKYDAIICNPPFFEGDLRSSDEKKNAARHDTGLTLRQLLKAVDQNIKKDGIFAILLPYYRVDDFINEAADLNFYSQQKILLRHSAKHPYFRVILFLSKIKHAELTKELIIKNEDDNYTESFIHLLKDYYLYL
jgi:tRNA1Val (adenine37-N6)-methyltransferase